MSVNATYDFPTYIYPTDFQFDNCTEAALVWQYFRGMSVGQEDFVYSKEAMYNFVIHSLKDWIQNVSLQTPPMTEEFWTWAFYSDIALSAEDYTYATPACSNELCGVEGWSSNPDLVGPGMLVTYIIQAILVTVYLSAFLIVHFNHSIAEACSLLHHDPLDRKSSMSRRLLLVSRVLVSFSDSMDKFLSASAMFSIALLAASIYSIARTDLTPTFTTWGLDLVIPINSVLPVIILQLITVDRLNRHRGRAMLWILIGALAVALAARSPFYLKGKFHGKFNFGDDYTSPVEKSCTGSESTKTMAIFAWTVAGVVALGISFYVVALLIATIRNQLTAFGRYEKLMRWFVLGLTLCTMWVFLGWFVRLTLAVRRRAGDKNKDNEWTFGQVLALATWVPFIIEFAYILWEGPVEAKKGREMKSDSVELQGKDETFVMERPGEHGGRGVFQRLDSWRTDSR